MRIRTIKPQFFKNEDLAELSPWTRLLFMGLWLMADGKGRLEHRPSRIKVELFPYDDISMLEHLKILDARGFIIIYKGLVKKTAHGEYRKEPVPLIQVTNFESHQRITGTEAMTPSRYEPFHEPNSRLFKHEGNSLETLGNHSGNNIETQEGKGKEGKGRERGAPTPYSDDESEIEKKLNAPIPFSAASLGKEKKIFVDTFSQDPNFRHLDLGYYFDKISMWSQSKTVLLANSNAWKAQCKSWMLEDMARGKAVTSNPASEKGRKGREFSKM